MYVVGLLWFSYSWFKAASCRPNQSNISRFPHKCSLQAHGEPDPVEHDLDVHEDRNLFTVCPPGGCEARLSEEQRTVSRRLHTCLSVLVRRFDPAKQNISAFPLLLFWQSRKQDAAIAAMLAFRTYTANLDMILLEMMMDSSESRDLCFGLQPPFKLQFKSQPDGSPSYFNDMSLCVTLASISDDWMVSRLVLGDLGNSLGSLSAVDMLNHDAEELLGEAARLKEEQRALRAAKLMHRAVRPRHQQRREGAEAQPRARQAGRGRPQGRGRGRGRARRRVAPDSEEAEEGAQPEEEEEAEAAEWLFDADDEDGDDVWGLRPPDSRSIDGTAAPSSASGSTAAHAVSAGQGSSSKRRATAEATQDAEVDEAAVPAGDVAVPDGVPPVPSVLEQRRAFRHVRQNRRRGIPWGPFQLQPIVTADGEQKGWGAVCGQHFDRDSSNQCKKAVSSSVLEDSVCMLRLKRWLFAGLNDEGWPLHAQRQHHVRMGGLHLQDFASGLSEQELDRRITVYAG